MNTKQILLFIILIFISFAVITLPLWIDRVLPYLDSYLRAVVAAAGRWIDVLKGIVGK